MEDYSQSELDQQLSELRHRSSLRQVTDVSPAMYQNGPNGTIVAMGKFLAAP